MAATQAMFVRRLRTIYGLNVVTRRGWGTKYPNVYLRRLITHRAKVPVDTVVQHITVTFDTGVFLGDFRHDMQLLERIGMDRFGSGVSYNAVFDKTSGMVGIGMPLRAKGTHTVNNKNRLGFSFDQNYWSRGLAWLGVPGDVPSPACRRSIAAFIACMMDTGHCSEDPDYKPHSFFTAKECPMPVMVGHMDEILAEAKRLHRLNGNKPTPLFRRR
jgi:hypothetical protein